MKKIILIIILALGITINSEAQSKSYKLIETYVLDLNTNKIIGVQKNCVDEDKTVINNGKEYFIFDKLYLVHAIQIKKRIAFHTDIKGEVYLAKIVDDNYNEELPVVFTKVDSHTVIGIIWSKDNVECFMY